MLLHFTPSDPVLREGSIIRLGVGSDLVGLGLYQAIAQRVAHHLGPIVQVKLVEDIAHVELDRVLADAELPGPAFDST